MLSTTVRRPETACAQGHAPLRTLGQCHFDDSVAISSVYSGVCVSHSGRFVLSGKAAFGFCARRILVGHDLRPWQASTYYPTRRHLDDTSGWPEMRSVDCTAAVSGNLFLQSGDATEAGLSDGELRSVCHSAGLSRLAVSYGGQKPPHDNQVSTSSAGDSPVARRGNSTAFGVRRQFQLGAWQKSQREWARYRWAAGYSGPPPCRFADLDSAYTTGWTGKTTGRGWGRG